MGRVVELRAGAREPEIGDRLAWDGLGWVPEVNIARPRGVTHVHTDTMVHIVMGPWRSPDFVSGSAGWQIDADGSAEFNNVTVRGTIYADAGEIGGWTISSGVLTGGDATLSSAGWLRLGTGDDIVRLDALQATYRIWVGNVAAASAPFRVSKGGEVWATNAHVTGEIDANSGHIGNLDVDGVLTVGIGTPVIQLDGSHKYIQTSDYASGISGFRIAHTGDAEFNNATIRGSLHCAVFVKDLISAHAGTLLVTKSSGVLIADWTVGATILAVETPPGGGWLFDTGDVVRIREEYAGGVHESWSTVTRTIYVNQYSNVLSSGDNTTYHKGTAVVDYGQSGDGGILQTADMTNAPWLSVFTHAGAPWTTLTHHLRLGNLNGVGDYSSDKYGVFIGDYAGDKWMSYDPTNSLRIRGDAIIDGTIVATKLSMGIGDSIFNTADGLLLLGPNCEISDSGWWSLRKQKATISGAFHQEAGRWLGTRGLVVEPATKNWCTNPSVETNITGWSNYGTAPTTKARDSTYARYGDYSLHIVCAAALSGVEFRNIAGSNGETFIASIWIYGTGALVGDTLEIFTRDYTNGVVGSIVAWTVVPGWQRVVTTAQTLTADSTDVTLLIRNTGSSTDEFWLDGVLIEKKSCATTYCDGAQGHEYTWDGTAHASTSQRAVTRLNLDALTKEISGKNALSFQAWVQAPYDWNVTWILQSAQVFDTRGADNNNRIFLAYDSVDDRFEFYVNGLYRINTSGVTFSAGDWLHLVAAVDFTGNVCTLYLNGEVIGSGNVGGTSAPTLTTWGLCGGYSGANQGGWRIGEYAVFDKVLSATEIAGMFATQQPLVDAGSLDSPGIYILDGQFRMASSLTGNRIEIDADEIAGYNSLGTKQFYLRASDGAACAGGGVVRLDADGLQIVASSAAGDPERIHFRYDSSGTIYTQGDICSDWGGGGADPNITWLTASRDAGAPWPAGVQVVLMARDTVVGTDVRLVVNSNKTVEVYGEDKFIVEKLLRPGTGTSDPTAGLEDGCLFYRTDTDKLRLRANGAWVNLN